MAINAFSSVCSTDCNTVVQFPAIDTIQDCVGAGHKYRSEICDFWLKPNAAADTPFTGWTALITDAITQNAIAIDNTVVDNSKCKYIVGIGNIAAPEETERTFAKYKTVVTKRTYTLTIRVDNVSDEQYEFLRSLQCGDTSFTFWYGTENHVFGSATGIEPVKVNAQLPLEEGEESYQYGLIIIEFEALVSPERRNNPYA